jgi:hypothetical protein
MITDNTNFYDSPVRNINARVDLYEGATLADSYTKYYALKEFSIERVGETKFFGFGICQRFNVHLVDKDRNIYITTADNFRVFLSTGGDYKSTFPTFYVTETHRNENTNELSVTAYDAIYKAATHTVAELELETPYTIAAFVAACANLLGVSFVELPAGAGSFGLEYEAGANFDGTESIREALNAIAEATQTIYFLNGYNTLVFKRLDVAGDPVAEISREAYFTLDSGENRRLATITHATELGDTVSVSTVATGTTQYIRDNPFWDLREDIDILLNDALAAVGGLTINQFSCEWRGNPALEIGDKIRLTTKDNGAVISYLLDDVINYDGGLTEVSRWEFANNEEESAGNPVTLGDALKQTYARVDKANKEITLLASDVSQEKEKVASLLVDTESIVASVSSLEAKTDKAVTDIAGNVETLASQVSAKMSAEDVQIKIDQELANGVDKVVTTTGFTFNETGLTVSKSGSEMTTTITEDGMQVFRDNTAVLTANNTGVDAVNLHASTFLIIGGRSRFENFGDNRTGCFWIGG